MSEEDILISRFGRKFDRPKVFSFFGWLWFSYVKHPKIRKASKESNKEIMKLLKMYDKELK